MNANVQDALLRDLFLATGGLRLKRPVNWRPVKAELAIAPHEQSCSDHSPFSLSAAAFRLLPSQGWHSIGAYCLPRNDDEK